MKRESILVVILSMLTSFSLNAQTLTNYGFKFGAVASNPNWKIGTHSYDGVETKVGLDAGVFLNWNLAINISMLTEMHYIQKGLRFYQPVVNMNDNGAEAYIESVNPNVNYLSFPVMVKYDLLNSEVIPYLIGGLRIDFVLSKSVAASPRWLYSNVNNTDFGGIIGLGFQTKSLFGIGTGLEMKYSPSFIQMDSSPMTDITNRSFEINLIIYN